MVRDFHILFCEAFNASNDFESCSQSEGIHPIHPIHPKSIWVVKVWQIFWVNQRGVFGCIVFCTNRRALTSIPYRLSTRRQYATKQNHSIQLQLILCPILYLSSQWCMGASQLIVSPNYSIVELICKAVNNFTAEWDAAKCEHRGDPTLLWMSPYDVFLAILRYSDPHSDGLPLMAFLWWLCTFLESTTDRNHNISTKFIVNTSKKHFYLISNIQVMDSFWQSSALHSYQLIDEQYKSGLKRVQYIDNTCIKFCNNY